MNDVDVAIQAIQNMAARIDYLERELARERVRLAACGVVALANTRESAREARREIRDDYKSGACDLVADAVDHEMTYRERIAELEHALRSEK